MLNLSYTWGLTLVWSPDYILLLLSRSEVDVFGSKRLRTYRFECLSFIERDWSLPST